MNKLLTIVFSAYQSHQLLNTVIKRLPNSYKVIVIENSLDKKLKISLEEKFNNVNVIIPKENLGLSKSYNLGIKAAKTKYVFLNNPDHKFDGRSIKKLIECATKIKNFGIISPTYKNEKIFKNYEIYENKKKYNNGVFKKFGIIEVDIIDNCFLINKINIKNNCFDENYFLYFETFDFCKNLINNKKKLYVCNKIKYHHPGGQSSNKRYRNIVILTRAFHYNWSKFYFFKKHFGILLAIKKIFPNFLKALKKIFFSSVTFNSFNLYVGLIELVGILTSVLSIKPFYRPKK